MENKKKCPVGGKGIGGQAVIEGVMMRGKKLYALAVRTPKKEIVVEKTPIQPAAEKCKILGWPIIRGVVAFVDSLVMGMKVTTKSATLAGLDDIEYDQESKFEKWLESKFGDKLADYLIIMNYDEHTSGSKEAGSVSSMSYAENSIKETINQAKDSSRIVGAIPFYTRAWKETPEEYSDGTGVFVEDAANGNYYLASEALGMEAAEKAYNRAGVKPSFDKTTGQNFVTYQKGHTTVSIWLEDETSVKSRLELMKKYNLAGAAYWSLGQEKADIWNIIDQYFE